MARLPTRQLGPQQRGSRASTPPVTRPGWLSVMRHNPVPGEAKQRLFFSDSRPSSQAGEAPSAAGRGRNSLGTVAVRGPSRPAPRELSFQRARGQAAAGAGAQTSGTPFLLPSGACSPPRRWVRGGTTLTPTRLPVRVASWRSGRARPGSLDFLRGQRELATVSEERTASV